jgi:hypothetical protein
MCQLEIISGCSIANNKIDFKERSIIIPVLTIWVPEISRIPKEFEANFNRPFDA